MLDTFYNTKNKQIALPDFGGAPIADTHAHLDMLEDPARALARASLAGVNLVVTLVNVVESLRTFAELDSWKAQAAELLAPFSGTQVPEVKIIAGSHPHDASKFDARARELLIDSARDARVVGLGEAGLDYYYDYSPRDIQRAVFAEQLKLAHELDLVACLHIRDAHADALTILQEYGLPKRGCILHCYTLDAQTMQPFVDLGCYVSFAGPVTFKKADVIRGAAAQVPHDKLLTETDCPFMAPEPCRGLKNEPALTVFTAEKLAEVLAITNKELAEITFANARRLFG